MVAIRMAAKGELQRLPDQGVRLAAPRLLWTEACSVLHRMMRRRRSDGIAELEAFDRVLDGPIELVDGYDRRVPWDLASLLGWHKTYDAEYLAAARHVGAGIVTLDGQMADGARRLGIPVVVPT